MGATFSDPSQQPSDSGASGVKPFRIALISDLHYSELSIQHGPLRLDESIRVGEAVVASLNADPPDLVVWAGDMTHEGSDAVRRGFAGLVNATKTHSVVVTGNHDVDRVSKREFASSVPVTRQAWLSTHGWNIVAIDTVRELSREDATGRFGDPDLQLLRAACSESDTPLLVLGHHPLNDKWIDQGPFWEAVQGRDTLSAYVGAHTHQYLFKQNGPWQLFETGSVTVAPFKYCEIDLEPSGMSIRTRLTSDSTGDDQEIGPARSSQWLGLNVTMGEEWTIGEIPSVRSQ